MENKGDSDKRRRWDSKGRGRRKGSLGPVRRGEGREAAARAHPELRVWTGLSSLYSGAFRTGGSRACRRSQQCCGPADVGRECPLQPLARARCRAAGGRRPWKDCYLGELDSLKTAMCAAFRSFSKLSIFGIHGF